ncbi:MAG: NAD-binding protein [Phycisphaerales bacterium]|nr:NAD-binding protein [Phycisphaerales bacterium]
MKSIATQLLILTSQRRTQRNLKVLGWFMLILFALMSIHFVLFHVIMEYEGQEHSLMTGLYWVIMTMSTTGFGEIRFSSDLGRIFTIFVIISGTIFLLALLPFMFIQFFYAPWMEAQTAARTPRSLPEDTTDHIVLTRLDPVTEALIAKLKQVGQSYVMIVPDVEQARKLHDMDVRVMVGELDDPATFEAARVRKSAMVVTTRSDAQDTTVAFTVRAVCEKVPVVATADLGASVPILELAGATSVVRLDQVMGQALARCIAGGDALTHVVARFDNLLIAEASAARTPLIGKSLRENQLRELGVSVVGLWDRGAFRPARPDTVVDERSVMLLAGSASQLEKYDEHFAIYNVSGEPVIVIGNGRIGQATAKALQLRGIDFRIIEKSERRVTMPEKTIVGDAAEPRILEEAGLSKAPTVVITTNADDTNLYLTLLCRKLRPDIEVIARCTLDKHVPALHRAGADFVQSFATIGASSIYNLLQHGRLVTVAQGLEVFDTKVPSSLAGKRIIDSGLREATGCTIVGYRDQGGLTANPPATMVLEPGHELVLIGDLEARQAFLATYAEQA